MDLQVQEPLVAALWVLSLSQFNSLSSLANERAVEARWGLRVVRTKVDSNDIPRDSKTLAKETGLLLVSLSSDLLTLSARKREADTASGHFLLTWHFFKIGIQAAFVNAEHIQDREPCWLTRYLRFLRSARPGSEADCVRWKLMTLGADERLESALLN